MPYKPAEPQGNSAFLNWAQKTHREAHVRKKMNHGPGVLVNHTTKGTVTKGNFGAAGSGGTGGNVPKWG